MRTVQLIGKFGQQGLLVRWAMRSEFNNYLPEGSYQFEGGGGSEPPPAT